MPTYTTSWESVSDGQSNTYNPESLVGEDIGEIQSAQVQWEGVDGSETQTAENKNSSSGTHFSDGGSVSTTYPPVPDGYDFDGHEFSNGRLENNGDTDLTGDVDIDNAEEVNTWNDLTIESGSSATLPSSPDYGNYVGSSYTLTAYFGNNTINIEVTAYTQGKRTVTVHTEDPSVGGDVSAGGPNSLNDGEQSSWYDMTGLVADTDQTFNFSINGSNEARFRFEFEYTLPTADPTYGTLAVQYGGTWYEIAVAEETDSQLETDSVRINVDGNWGVLDMVPDTYSDEYTVDHIRIWDGAQWLKARAYNTRNV